MAPRPTILLADDEPAFRSLFEIWLGELGFDVRSACDGADALEWVAAAGLPDIALLDVNMPRVDGLELSRALRQVEPSLPVVLVSAHDELDELGRSVDASAVLRKPSSPDELGATLRRLLHGPAASVYAA